MNQDDDPNVQIDILEGHISSPYPYFWFRPVMISNTAHITYKDVIGLDEEFSIEQSAVDCFLAYFLSKYFESDLIYNRNRSIYRPMEFDWCGQNFFTYKTVRIMLDEIIKTAELFTSDYNNPALTPLKAEIEVEFGYIASPDTIIAGDTAIYNCRYILADFYRRFAARLVRMMEDNSSTDLISVEGS